MLSKEVTWNDGVTTTETFLDGNDFSNWEEDNSGEYSNIEEAK